ncbi:hypothetical protein S83_052445 [Arachis hypogaea]
MNATIVYLEGKAAVDPMSMARYNLIPCQHFGDVVAFDSTMHPIPLTSLQTFQLVPKVPRFPSLVHEFAHSIYQLLPPCPNSNVLSHVEESGSCNYERYNQ